MQLELLKEHLLPGTRFRGIAKSTSNPHLKPSIREILFVVQDATIETRICHQFRVHYLEEINGKIKPGKMTLKGFATWADKKL